MTEKGSGIRLLLGLSFLLGLCCCNFYKDTLGLEAESSEDHLLEGQLALQRAEYTQAKFQFEAALKIDSTKSEGYYGAAKAALLEQHINMFALLQSFQNNDGKSIPFLGEPDTIKNKVYVANRQVNQFLGLLIKREENSKSDKKVSAKQISADYALATTIQAVLSLADFNGDGYINEKDNLLTGIIDFSDPTKLQPDSIMKNLAALKNDTAKIQALNALLDKSGELLNQSSSAIDLLVSALSGDPNSASAVCPKDSTCPQIPKDKIGDSAAVQVKSFIKSAGSTMLIYKIYDGKDNDGDGCIDEEILDGIDNDGDGYIDEDNRGAADPLNPKFKALSDKADNNLNDTIDDTAEGAFDSRYQASLTLDEPYAMRIFYRDSIDTRVTVQIKDAKGKVTDSVSTFDLCNPIKVKGFR